MSVNSNNTRDLINNSIYDSPNKIKKSKSICDLQTQKSMLLDYQQSINAQVSKQGRFLKKQATMHTSRGQRSPINGAQTLNRGWSLMPSSKHNVIVEQGYFQRGRDQNGKKKLKVVYKSVNKIANQKSFDVLSLPSVKQTEKNKIDKAVALYGAQDSASNIKPKCDKEVLKRLQTKEFDRAAYNEKGRQLAKKKELLQKEEQENQEYVKKQKQIFQKEDKKMENMKYSSLRRVKVTHVKIAKITKNDMDVILSAHNKNK